MTTPRSSGQSWWQDLQDPGVNPKLTQILEVLQEIAQSLSASSGGTTSRSGSGRSTHTIPQSLAHLPSTMGTYPMFIRMADFTDLLLSAGVSGIYPEHVQEVTAVSSGSSNNFVYTPPSSSQEVLLPIGPMTIQSSDYSPSLHLNVTIDYHQADALIVVENVLLTESTVIGHEVIGQTPIRYNITAQLTNNTGSTVDVTSAISLAHISGDVWRTYYQPYFSQFLPGYLKAWMKEVTSS